VGAGTFLGLTLLYRSVYIAGRYGSGKTALAVAIARALARRGYRFVSNIPARGAAMYWPTDEIDHSVVLLDEAADFLDAYDVRQARRLMSAFKYLRHWDIVVLLPCVDLVQKRMRRLVVRRIFDASFLVFGLFPVWIYRFDIPEVRKAGGYFVFIPSPRDFDYAAVHRGRGTTTLQIVAALLAEARKSDIVAAGRLGLDIPARKVSF